MYSKVEPFAFTPRQAECMAAIDRLRAAGNIPRCLYGGAMGGGKSWLLCALAVQTCERTPGARVYLCRRESVVFKRTTLTVMLADVDILGRGGWEHHISDQYFSHANGSRIDYGGLADNADREKIKSLNLSSCGIDEASEVDQISARLLESRVGRIKEAAGSEWIVYVTNPEPCWLQAEYVDKQVDGRAYVQALPSDNPHLGEQYVAHLRATYADTPELLDAYLNGVWGAIGAHDRVYHPQAINDAMARVAEPSTSCVWGIDVARFGDDKTVVYECRGTAARQIAVWRHKDTRQTADDIVALFRAAEHDAPAAIAVDDCGVGGGVTDNLRRAGLPVTGVNVAVAATDREKYFNLRAEMAWTLRGMLNAGSITLPHDDGLRLELASLRYEIRNGRILVERKDELKARLGHSPDAMDALTLAVCAAREVGTMAYGKQAAQPAGSEERIPVLDIAREKDGVLYSPGVVVRGDREPVNEQQRAVAYGD